jgi:hypothetical protein
MSFRVAFLASMAAVAGCMPESGSSTGAGGASGTAGVTGSAGTTGDAGTTGSSGTTGAAGISGAAGTTGVAGTTGGAGTTGNAGTGGRGGITGTAGSSGKTGTAGRGGSGGTSGRGGSTGTAGRGGTTGAGGATGNFSFFVTSLASMRLLSNNQNGFGGDLRFGETGDGAGLRGADKICTTIAEMSMAGSGAKGWRAFLSTVAGPVHAIDRVGSGPWYDRMGRVVATNRAGLTMTRPAGDTAIRDDLPNEYGLPNHMDGSPGCTGNACPDNHDTLTASTTTGNLLGTTMGATCNDWTSAVGSTGRPGLGHSWPANSGMSWMQAHTAPGCAPSVALVQAGGPPAGAVGVGDGGGYGGIYCFALMP